MALTPKTATSYNESNIHSLYRFIARKGKKTVHEDDVSWVITKPSRWPNQIFNAQFSPEKAVESIQNVKEKILANEAPAVWMISPGSNPKNLGALLAREGFSRVGEQQGMALELSNLRGENRIGPKGFEIKSVVSDKALTLWLDVVKAAMFRGEPLDHQLFSSLLHTSGIAFYLGSADGFPVATSMSFRTADTVGLYLVSVLPEFRRRGIGLAVTRAPLLEATKTGCRVGVLQASEMGRGVYARLGFKQYCLFEFYKLDDSVSRAS